MTYILFPVRDGVVIEGPAVEAGYSSVSQDEAHAECLALNPSATGTARAWAGDADIQVGHEAGTDPLEVERRYVSAEEVALRSIASEARWDAHRVDQPDVRAIVDEQPEASEYVSALVRDAERRWRAAHDRLRADGWASAELLCSGPPPLETP